MEPREESLARGAAGAGSMLTLGWVFLRIGTLAFGGLGAALVGVLLATTYRLGKANIKEPSTLVIAVAACVVGVWLGLNAALIVVAAGVLGILLFAIVPTAAQQTKESGA